jgi:hypothetical protein
LLIFSKYPQEQQQQQQQKKPINVCFFFSLMQSFRCLQNKKNPFLSDFTIYTTQAQVKEKKKNNS